MTKKKPVMLVIMDGFGCSSIAKDNAVAQADLKVLPKLWKEYPHSYLGASGEDVGLPVGQIGNSEVGHLNIGAGRIVYQELTRITKTMQEGGFAKNAAFTAAIENCRKNGRSLVWFPHFQQQPVSHGKTKTRHDAIAFFRIFTNK